MESLRLLSSPVYLLGRTWWLYLHTFCFSLQPLLFRVCLPVPDLNNEICACKWQMCPVKTLFMLHVVLDFHCIP